MAKKQQYSPMIQQYLQVKGNSAGTFEALPRHL